MAQHSLHDRKEAGGLLAQRLAAYSNHPEVTVLGLPPGGVVVGYYVARALNAPLDVFIVRMLTVEQFEIGAVVTQRFEIGAVATGGVRVLDDAFTKAADNPKPKINAVAVREQQELKRLERLYRGGRAMHDVRGHTVTLVDDGLTRDSTLHAAVKAFRAHHPARVVVALPIARAELCSALRGESNEVVCGITSERSPAAGDWYATLEDTTDEWIAELLSRSKVAYRAPKGAAPAH